MTSKPARTLTDAQILEKFANAKRPPPCSKTLSMVIEAYDGDTQEVTMSFVGTEDWTNPMGNLQGGYLTTMLDECMSVAGIAAGEFKTAVPTLEMKTTFLRPAQPGPFKGIGKVRKNGKSIAFLEGELYDPDGKMVAKATATASRVPIPKRRA